MFHAGQFKNQVIAVRADISVFNITAATVSTRPGFVSEHFHITETVDDHFHQLFRHRVTEQVGTATGHKGGVLKFIRAGADQAVRSEERRVGKEGRARRGPWKSKRAV